MNTDLALAGRVSKEAIDHLTRQIRKIEGVVEKKIKLKEEYRYLLTLHGVGKILLTGNQAKYKKIWKKRPIQTSNPQVARSSRAGRANQIKGLTNTVSLYFFRGLHIIVQHSGHIPFQTESNFNSTDELCYLVS